MLLMMILSVVDFRSCCEQSVCHEFRRLLEYPGYSYSSKELFDLMETPQLAREGPEREIAGFVVSQLLILVSAVAVLVKLEGESYNSYYHSLGFQ